MRIQAKSSKITYSALVLVCILLTLKIMTSDPNRNLLGGPAYLSRLPAIGVPGGGHVHNFSIAELMGTSNVTETVRPNEVTVILEPTWPLLKIGRNGDTTSVRPFAVTFVTSLPRFFSQRQAIRATWYQWAEENNIRIFFVIGFHDFRNVHLFQLLEAEQSLYNDLIIDRYEEGYYRLPGKILRMLKWYSSTYSEDLAPRFLIKTDHDVFLNLPNIVASLERTPYYKSLLRLSSHSNGNSSTLLPDTVNLPLDASNPGSYFVGGKKFENAPVESDPDSKWYIDSSERQRLNWPVHFFPPYTNGPCYVISGNVVRPIYEASFEVPIYPFEDVYIIGMIAYGRLDLQISQLDNMWLDKSNFCYLKNRKKFSRMLALHPIEHPGIMVKVCKKIGTCKRNHARFMSSGTESSRSFLRIGPIMTFVLTLQFL